MALKKPSAPRLIKYALSIEKAVKKARKGQTMLINVDEFCGWINLQEDMEFKDKCMVKYLACKYADRHSVEAIEEDRKKDEWDDWLDSEIEYYKDDITKGLPANIYNTLRRGACWQNGELVHLNILRNRDIVEKSDRVLEEIRNMSKRKVELAREYIAANRKRILG